MSSVLSQDSNVTKPYVEGNLRGARLNDLKLKIKAVLSLSRSNVVTSTSFYFFVRPTEQKI